MLGTINPQTVRITQQAVVYPGRNHVTSLRVERFDGRTYKPVDMTAVTRVILSFPEASPVIVYDSSVQAVFTHVGTTLTVDLSDYAMPASVLGCQIILYDAEHPAGQVLVDDIDAVVQFDFRNVSPVGGIPAPAVDYLTDAPIDGVTYARKDGVWVPVDSLVSGVSSVNGQSGVVVLDAADVGADPTGTAATAAAAAVAAHTALADPHPQYLTPAEGNAAYDALGAATAAVSAHESDTTPHAFVQNMSKAGFNLTAAQTVAPGEMAWNATDATMDLGLPGGVTLQAGQEFLLRGLNNSGATMVDTTVVYISGAQGNRTVFSKAQANTVTADKTIGVLTQDITNNQEGFATLAGLVRGIDTSAWAEGSELWLSAATAGVLTTTKPAPPNNAVSLGYVVRSHVSLGSIYVRVAVRESIKELHDVVITAPTDGQVLVYDAATSTWVNEAGGGGSGEVNTASNLGAGSGLFAGKVGVDLQFKSLKAGAGVTLSSTATEVTIVASGAGGAVDSVNGQTGVVVLDTDDIAEGVSNLYFTNGRAAAAAPVQTVDGQTGAVSLSSSYAPLSHVGGGGAAHSNAVAAGAAGFMTGADKTKLDGIAAGAQVNVATDLSIGYNPAYVFVNSSTGADVALAGATDTAAGVMSSADKVKLDGIAAGATQNSSDAVLLARANHTGTQTASTISDFASASRAQTEAELVAGANVTITPSGSGATRQLTIAAAGGGGATNLSTTTSTTTLTVNSDTGTDAVLPAATGSVAGVLTAADKTKLDGIATGATVNSADAVLLARANHTGTQLSSTISDFVEAAQDVIGAAITAGTNVTVSYNDTTGLTTINASGGGTTLPVVRSITGDETLGLANINTFGVNSTTSNYVSTIPAQATVAWTADAELHFLPSSTGDITITAAAGVSLNGVVAGSLTLSTQNGAASLKRTAADSWWLGGVIGTTAEQRAALELVKQTSVSDITVGALMINGAWGIGETSLAPAITDCNTATTGGIFRFAAGTDNAPLTTLGHLLVFPYGGATSQMVIDRSSQRVFVRTVTSSAPVTWSPWRELWSSSGGNSVTVDTGSFGYGAGSGGTVTQATSKVTAVTLNKPAGRITTAADALAAGASAAFSLSNSMLSAADLLLINASANSNYRVECARVSAGSAAIRVTNVSGGSLSEAININFAVVKGATA